MAHELAIDLSEVDESQAVIGRIAGPPDPQIVALLQRNIGKAIRLPRMSEEQFEKNVRPAFTRASNSMKLLPLNWRDTQGRWYATVRTQDQKQVRPALSPEARKAAIDKAKATKAANKAAREAAKAATEATARAAETQKPQPVTPQRRAS
jgi:hypothetical protein